MGLLCNIRRGPRKAPANPHLLMEVLPPPQALSLRRAEAPIQCMRPRTPSGAGEKVGARESPGEGEVGTRTFFTSSMSWPSEGRLWGQGAPYGDSYRAAPPTGSPQPPPSPQNGVGRNMRITNTHEPPSTIIGLSARLTEEQTDSPKLQETRGSGHPIRRARRSPAEQLSPAPGRGG